MTQTELAPEDYDQDNQDASQSVVSSGSVEDGKEKFKIMIHKILGVADTKQIDKICCFFKINKQWSRTRQLFCTYSLFLTFFMVTILGYFVFYLKFSPNYVGDTILDQIDDSISDNFKNSLQEYSKQVHQYFKSYSSWMFMFSEIFSNHIGWNDSLFEKQEQMHIGPKQRYFKVNDPIPSDLVHPIYSYKAPYNKKITFQTFSYIALAPDDSPTLSPATKEIIDSIDILSYFFKNFIGDPNISYIQSLYIFVEERSVLCFFPGGLVEYEQGQDLDARKRPWYIKSKQSFETNKKVPTFTITGPYPDLVSKQQTVTYSLPIVKKSNKNEIAAIMNVDIIINNFKSVYDLLQDKDGEFQIALIDYQSELIINDCFKAPKIINFYDTQYTGFTSDNWSEIKDFSRHQENSTFIIQNSSKIKYYIARTKIQDTVSKDTTRFMLIVFGKESTYLSYRNEIQDRIDSQLYDFCVSLIIALSILWFVCYFYIYFLSQNIVQPLARLSKLAKSINKSEERKNSTEDIKEQLSKISGADADTKKLIDSFINLVDQHSGMRKLANGTNYQDNIIPLYNKTNNMYENYPRNDCKDELDDIKEQLRFLKNFDQDPDDDDDDNGSNQDVDEVCAGNPKCKSYSSMQSNRCQNEDDMTEVDNINNPNNKHHKKKQIGHEQDGLLGGKATFISPNSSIVSNIPESRRKEKYYFKWLKEQLYVRQENEPAKVGLSQQVLTQFLPQNTQSI